MKAQQRMFCLLRYRFVAGRWPVRPPLSRNYQSMVNAVRRLGVELPPPYGLRGEVDIGALPVVDSVQALWVLGAA